MNDQASVRIERNDGWAAVVLNRPHRKNALTGPMGDSLASAINDLGNDANVAAIVLRGEGGAFCSGIDLKELQLEPPHAWLPELPTMLRRAHLALFSCPLPIIGALEGFAINAGSALAVACDVLVAGDGSFLQVGEIQQGVHIPMNAAWLRLKHSETVLARLALYGDRVAAGELLRLGIATEVVADADVVDRAEQIAARIAGFPAGSSRAIVADIRRQRQIDPDLWFPSPDNAAIFTAPPVTG